MANHLWPSTRLSSRFPRSPSLNSHTHPTIRTLKHTHPLPPTHIDPPTTPTHPPTQRPPRPPAVQEGAGPGPGGGGGRRLPGRARPLPALLPPAAAGRGRRAERGGCAAPRSHLLCRRAVGGDAGVWGGWGVGGGGVGVWGVRGGGGGGGCLCLVCGCVGLGGGEEAQGGPPWRSVEAPDRCSSPHACCARFACLRCKFNRAAFSALPPPMAPAGPHL
jgi:hypothetical protein